MAAKNDLINYTRKRAVPLASKTPTVLLCATGALLWLSYTTNVPNFYSLGATINDKIGKADTVFHDAK